eukprot:scaffold102918_cov19-Tisochrysis_lutea.AAC.3
MAWDPSVAKGKCRMMDGGMHAMPHGLRAEAEANSVAEQPMAWDPSVGYRKLLGALVARGKAAGWLISPSEPHKLDVSTMEQEALTLEAFSWAAG